MSAESPTTDREYFNYNERSSTPPPTTSSYIPKHDPPVTKLEKEPIELVPSESKDNKDSKEDDDKEKEEKDDKAPLGPGANPGHKKDDNAITKADGGKKDKEGDHKQHNSHKMNGGTDAFDGKLIHPPPKPEEEEEDACVKCLYYSMQCCECTIM